MKYYRAIEDIIDASGKIIPKGSVTSEITYDGKDAAIQALFEDDVETTEEIAETLPPPASPPEGDALSFDPAPKKWNLPYADDTGYENDVPAPTPVETEPVHSHPHNPKFAIVLNLDLYS